MAVIFVMNGRCGNIEVVYVGSTFSSNIVGTHFIAYDGTGISIICYEWQMW
jgi:hypothetical protein